MAPPSFAYQHAGQPQNHGPGGPAPQTSHEAAAQAHAAFIAQQQQSMQPPPMFPTGGQPQVVQQGQPGMAMPQQHQFMPQYPHNAQFGAGQR